MQALESGVPSITTDRLILRGWRAEDFAPYAALVADPESARFIARGARPYNEDQAWAEVCFFIGHWAMRGFGMFVVEDRQTGAFLGRVGALWPHSWPGLELAWALTPQARGAGFATEAAQAALSWIFANTAADDVISIIHHDNAASQRVALRLGEHKTTQRFSPLGEPCDVWQIDRSAWNKRPAEPLGNQG